MGLPNKPEHFFNKIAPTDLPELPDEKMFFKVRYFAFGCYEVELRRKGRVFSHCVKDYFIGSERADDPAEYLRAMKFLVQWYHEQAAYNQRVNEIWAR